MVLNVNNEILPTVTIFSYVMKTILTVLLMILAVIPCEAQDGGVSSTERIKEDISDNLFAVPQEKIYIQTDRYCYMPEDTIWFRTHLVDGQSNIPSTSRLYPSGRSRFVYVELHDIKGDSLIERAMIKADSTGTFANMLVLPKNLNSGIYCIMAYTRWMMNFPNDRFAYKAIRINNYGQTIIKEDEKESNKSRNDELPYKHDIEKTIEEPSVAAKTKKNKTSRWQRENVIESKDLSVTVFPESGHLITGHLQKLAFKAIGPNGYGVDVNVRIVRKQNDSIIAEANSEHRGMGYLYFTPEKGQTYMLEAYTDDGRSCHTDVPYAMEHGVAFTVNQRKEKIFVKPIIEGIEQKKLILIVYGRDNPVIVKRVNKDGHIIDTSSMSPGVINIAIADEVSRAVYAERTVFIWPHKETTVSIKRVK